MVVVDEVHISVLDPLMVRDVGVGRAEPYPFGDDLLQWPALAHQLVIHLARPLLVARQDAIFQLAVERLRLRGIADRGLHVVGHSRKLLCRSRRGRPRVGLNRTNNTPAEARAATPPARLRQSVWLSCSCRMAPVSSCIYRDSAGVGRTWSQETVRCF